MAASITFKPSCSVLLYKQIAKQILTPKEFCVGIATTSNKLCTTNNATSSGSNNVSELDPFPTFKDRRVQKLLSKITGFDVFKIAGPHKKMLQKPKYKLLTDEQLKKEMDKAKLHLKERLQIPPYMNPRKPNLEPLSVDPDLAHHDTASFVFTDVTFGLKNRDRNVLMREPDGTLRHAPWDVKDRMNQIYNPREGKEYLKPQMFEEQHLERMISEMKYVYILDRACCQFEPDDPDFIRTTHRVYKAVDTAGHHDELRSTRHLGSLAFYLIWYKMADKLLLDMLNRDLASDAVDLVRLYAIVHPESKCAASLHDLSADADYTAFVQIYLETTASDHTSEIELALQALMDVRKGDSR